MERRLKMDILKEKLGDKYDEFMELIGEDIKLTIDDGEIKIPKSRFDEVNGKYKDTKRALEELQNKQMTEDEKIQKIIDEANEAKATYMRELSKLKATEIFVKAGLEEDEYKELVENISTDNAETTVNMANLMVNVIKNRQEKTEKAVKKQLLKDTPTPEAGEQDNTEAQSIAEKLAQETNEQENQEVDTFWS